MDTFAILTFIILSMGIYEKFLSENKIFKKYIKYIGFIFGSIGTIVTTYLLGIFGGIIYMGLFYICINEK